MNGPAYRIDGRDAAREGFYAVACDPRRSVVVEACAGAGKTWMLVSRILRALLDGAAPHEILAITFTRKAAGEMRTRLAEWLAELAAADDAHRTRALVERGIAPAEAARLAPVLADLHERVLAMGRSVEVRTFHAWFSQLLRAAPLELLGELGLQPRMELVEALDDLKLPLFKRFHAALLRDPARRADLDALLHRHGRVNVAKWLEAAWSKRVEIELADGAGSLLSSVPDAPLEWPARAPLVALARRLAAKKGKKALDAALAIETALTHADEREMTDALWSALFTGGGEPRKQIADDDADWHAACACVLRAREAQAQHDAHEDQQCMARLSRVLFAEYAALKRSRSLADMADLERCAGALLGHAALAGWVQERLDARVRHVLIDEFQDTSPLQWQALHGWLGAYAGAGGGREAPSVFIVGDPKQSIYRFRGAEPRVFDAAREFVAQGLGGSVLACDHTRRNAPAVVEALNAVFAPLVAQHAFAGFRPHTTEVASGAGDVARLPGVERAAREKAVPAHTWRPSLTMPRVEPQEKAREEEARRVARHIAHLVRQEGVAPGDIMVLSRKRESLRLAGAALQALHLPFVAPEDSVLAALPEVRDLVAVLDVLASPGHDLSLAHALKSPLFGASDDDLLVLAHAAREPRVAWRAALDALAAPSPALARARDLLAAWSAAARRLPPHDLLDRIVAEGDLMARLAAAVPPERRAAAKSAVDALMVQALALDGGRYATPYNMVRALRARLLTCAAGAQPEAVQLLTVHGAKGLEARVVLVMDADAERQNGEHAGVLIEWPVQARAPRRVAFVASLARCAPSLRGLRDEEAAAREREELNGLYVAMTRARERLVFSRTEPHRGGARPWWTLLADAARPLDLPPPAPPVPAAHETARVPVLPALPARSAAAPKRPQADDDVASRLGQAVHRVLEWAAGPLGRPLPALAGAAAAEFGLAGRAADVEAIAGRVLASPAAARFFDRDVLQWAGNEVPVAGPDGEVLRIDRLVRLPDAWWVLDYKLQSSPLEVPQWRAQLARYREAVERLQPGEPVRAAFLTGAGAVVEP